MQGMTPLDTAGFAHPPRNVDALGITPGMAVADFGSGSGAYVLSIAERLANAGHVYAIDVQRDLLRRIKNEAHARGFNNVEIVWSDLESPNGSKIKEKHLDLVLISNLLFQVPDKNILFHEAKRILKPAGRLAVIDWSDAATHGMGRIGPRPKDVVIKEKALEFAIEAGFALDREFDAGAHHYGMIFVKQGA